MKGRERIHLERCTVILCLGIFHHGQGIGGGGKESANGFRHRKQFRPSDINDAIYRGTQSNVSNRGNDVVGRDRLQSCGRNVGFSFHDRRLSNRAQEFEELRRADNGIRNLT